MKVALWGQYKAKIESMVSTYHFALGVKRKACTNFLDSIWGTIGFFEKIRIKFAIWGQWKTKNELIQSFLPRALIYNYTLTVVFRLNVHPNLLLTGP